MKKIIAIFLSFIIITLAACGTGSNSEEVYKNALKASENLKSFEVEITLEQLIKNDDGSELGTNSIPLTTNAVTKMQMEPLFSSINEINGYNSGNVLHSSMYANLGDNQWIQLPQDELAQFNQLIQTQQQSPADQLDQVMQVSSP